MTARPRNRRRVEIYFVLYVVALVLLMPDPSDQSKSTGPSPYDYSRLDLQPERVRLESKAIRDTGNQLILIRQDSLNVIRYTGAVTDVRISATVYDEKAGKDIVINPGDTTTRLFSLVHDPARSAAIFHWRPALMQDDISRTFRVTLTAMGVPTSVSTANANEADDVPSGLRIQGSTQFMLAYVVDDKPASNTIVQLPGKVDTIRIRDGGTSFGGETMLGEFWVQPARERVTVLQGTRWTNRISVGGADVSRDLATAPVVKASGDGSASVRSYVDAATRTVILDGIAPRSGTLNVDVTLQRRDGQSRSASFIVSAEPLAALALPESIYPGVEAELATRLPSMPGIEVVAVLKGERGEIQRTTGDMIRYTPSVSDTGKVIYLERYVDDQRVGSPVPIRIRSFDAPEILAAKDLAGGTKKRIVVKYFGPKMDRPVLDIVDGNVGRIQTLYGNNYRANDRDPAVPAWIIEFDIERKDGSRPFAFRIQARDKRGMRSRTWSE